jgi:flavin reductase (DIM6/NTAB) family NADH-FMN oxidoreductase RutF
VYKNETLQEETRTMSKTKLGPQTLLYPMPAVLVGSLVDGKANFMTAAWCGIACMKPPAISVAIRSSRHTLKGIEKNSSFSINVPSSEMVKKVDYCGIYSGAKRDKSTLFDVFYGDSKSAPLIQECPVNLECTVVHLLNLGSHTLVVGEIVETHVTEDCLKEGTPDPHKIDPLVFLPSGREYWKLGTVIAKAFEVGKDT